MPDERVFVDTNIFVYAYDRSAGRKHDIAANRLIELWETGRGMASLQILAEFYVTVTAKIPRPVAPAVAEGIVEDLLKWDIVPSDGASLRSAIAIHRRNKISLWNAMIVESAGRGGASVLLTEDLSHGQELKGVTVRNPFL